MWIAIGALALLGCVLSAGIVLQKKGRLPIACPVGQDCDRVVHGPYSRFLDVPHELLGLGYYGAVVAYVAVTQGGAGMLAGLPPGSALFAVIAGAAALYSAALLFIQTRILQARCPLCIASTAVSVLIFLLCLV